MLSMSDSPADRLRKLRAKKYETAKEAADAFGWNEVTYRAHENGGRTITLPAARKYASALGSTASFILGLGGNPEQGPIVNQIVHVPLVGRISAGVFRYEEGLFHEGILVPAIPKPGVAAASQYAVIIDGPSVNLRIPDGMYAICAPYEEYPGGAQHGQLVHVVRERAGLFEHTIKEIHYSRSGITLAPASNDPRYQDTIVLNDTGDVDNVTIKGVVIGAYQPF